jgi:hypothetical protein
MRGYTGVKAWFTLTHDALKTMYTYQLGVQLRVKFIGVKRYIVPRADSEDWSKAPDPSLPKVAPRTHALGAQELGTGSARGLGVASATGSAPPPPTFVTFRVITNSPILSAGEK